MVPPRGDRKKGKGVECMNLSYVSLYLPALVVLVRSPKGVCALLFFSMSIRQSSTTKNQSKNDEDIVCSLSKGHAKLSGQSNKSQLCAFN